MNYYNNDNNDVSSGSASDKGKVPDLSKNPVPEAALTEGVYTHLGTHKYAEVGIGATGKGKELDQVWKIPGPDGKKIPDLSENPVPNVQA